MMMITSIIGKIVIKHVKLREKGEHICIVVHNYPNRVSTLHNNNRNL